MLREGQELAVQRLSAEMRNLMDEVDAEFTALLGQASWGHPPGATSHAATAPASAPSAAAALELSAVSPRPATALTAALGPPSTSLTTAAASPSALSRPSALSAASLLSLPPVADSSKAPGAAGAGAGAGAGSKAQRRKQNRQRSGLTAPGGSAALPASEAKYKAQGRNSLAIFMGTFSKDRILTSGEELELASAAQDYMYVKKVMQVLGGVLKRAPTLEEVAESLGCDVSSLSVRLECGGRARAILAQKNYRYVVNIAKRLVRSYGPRGGGARDTGGGGGGSAAIGAVSLEDAITAGVEGLLTAIEKFRPEAGCRLSTYATWWIRQHVFKFIRIQTGVIRMPMSLREDIDRLARTRAVLYRELGRPPSDGEVAAVLGITASRVAVLDDARRSAGGARSFEAPLSEDGSLTQADAIAQTEEDEHVGEGAGSYLSVDSEEHYALATDLTATVDAALASLDLKDAEALRRMYLDGDGSTAVLAAGATAAGGGGEGGSSGGVLPGRQRLKLGGAHFDARRALQQLRRRTSEDKRLADWAEAKTSKANYPVRTPGYVKKT